MLERTADDIWDSHLSRVARHGKAESLASRWATHQCGSERGRPRRGRFGQFGHPCQRHSYHRAVMSEAPYRAGNQSGRVGSTVGVVRKLTEHLPSVEPGEADEVPVPVDRDTGNVSPCPTAIIGNELHRATTWVAVLETCTLVGTTLPKSHRAEAVGRPAAVVDPLPLQATTTTKIHATAQERDASPNPWIRTARP